MARKKKEDRSPAPAAEVLTDITKTEKEDPSSVSGDSRNKMEEKDYVQNGVSRLVFVLLSLILEITATVIGVQIADANLWIFSFLIRMFAFSWS